MIAIDAVKRTIVLVKKFGLYLCVPVFLMIAYSYTSSTYSEYKVTAKISLNGAPAESAVNDIKSKYLVRKALEQLPFQASFYDSNSPRDEVFGNALPVKMIFERARYSDDEVWLNLEATGKNSFALTHGDTVAYHEFNKPVHEWYGNFKVVQKPAVQYSQVSYLVRLDPTAKLAGQYYNGLRAETVGDDGVILSITSGSAQKGIDFLNKLIHTYSNGKHAISHHSYASHGGAGRVTILEKPENSVESTGLNSFWIYFIALLIGLAIPLGVPAIRERGIDALPFKLSGLSKLRRGSPQPVVAKQLGLKVARYRRLLFREA
ncbi:MAG: hypothetical protein ACXVI9_11755 [Mucilaginibacter sp.]